jgi:hypothetical protein
MLHSDHKIKIDAFTVQAVPFLFLHNVTQGIITYLCKCRMPLEFMMKITIIHILVGDMNGGKSKYGGPRRNSQLI